MTGEGRQVRGKQGNGGLCCTGEGSRKNSPLKTLHRDATSSTISQSLSAAAEGQGEAEPGAQGCRVSWCPVPLSLAFLRCGGRGSMRPAPPPQSASVAGLEPLGGASPSPVSEPDVAEHQALTGTPPTQYQTHISHLLGLGNGPELGAQVTGLPFPHRRISRPRK